ncbi:UNVERIFIED_CONTAM: hypothetical protein FKN15_012062, partial [Acipenser sinensis]
CNDPEISSVPANFPLDTSKLRIEKTAIKRVPSEAFHYLSNLEFLWMSFNSLSTVNADSFRGLYNLDELRLDGNTLTYFPWESIIDMPNLRLLDLHNNQLTSMPSEAMVYLKNITYLDLSSNNLVTVPSELMATWLSVKPTQGAYIDNSKIILGLHDNPWFCDCRLYDLVNFLKSPSSSVAFIDGRLRCSEPDSLSGVLFSEVEPRQCQMSTVHTAVARVKTPVGNNVILRCSTIGVPIPEFTWRRVDGKQLSGTVQQEISKEGIIWSIFSIPAVSYHDSSKYVCRARNFVGSAEAIISLVITDVAKAENQTTTPTKKTRIKRPNGVGKAAYQEKLVARYVVPTTTSQTPNIKPLGYTEKYAELENHSIVKSEINGQTSEPNSSNGPQDRNKTNVSSLPANTSSLQQELEQVVRSVKIIGDTDHTVTLTWRAPTAKNTTIFSVLYAIFGERDMRRINVGPSKNRITIDGLMPKTKYIAFFGLHDNPWFCDCRLYDLVNFLKSPSSSVAFIDGRLRCSEPESLSGVLFSQVEPRKCQMSTVHTAVSRVKTPVGKNVILRCSTIGVPIPEFTWRRVDGKQLSGTVQQEISKEGIIWSIFSIPAVSYHDSSKYVCRARNFVGSAEAIISLVITDVANAENQTTTPTKKTRIKRPNGVGKAAYQEKLVARYVVRTTTSQTPNIKPLGYTEKYAELENHSIVKSEINGQTSEPNSSNGPQDRNKTNVSSLPANTSSLQQELEQVVRSVKIIGDTDHTVTLTWRAPTAKNTTIFSVLYAIFGERDMRRINVGPSKNRITIDGLMPKTKYIACVCVKGLIPKKEQCVIFSTDEAASASGTQKLINVVVITVACVIAVPLTLIVCCGALKRRCIKMFERKAKDIQDSYVTFEALSPGPKAKGQEGEYLTRVSPEESNRLLSARSSLDSEVTVKIEGQPNEYFC